MNKRKLLSLLVRIGLFILVLSLGTLAALVVDETPGLALADLDRIPVQVMSTAADRDAIYTVLDADTHRGIYRSADNGRTWQKISSGPDAAVRTLAVDPNNENVLYAGGPATLMNNVWRSQDGGQTWQPLNLDLPAAPEGLVPDVTTITVDPAQPNLIYVGTDGQGVYRYNAADKAGYEPVGGHTLQEAHVKDLVVGPDRRVYALTNSGMYVAAGYTWQKLEALPGFPVSLTVAPSDPNILYAGDATNGLYRSEDGGRTWEQAVDGLDLTPGASLRVTALAVDGQDAGRVIAATAYGLGSRLAPGAIYESVNGGDTWIKLADLEEIVSQISIDDGPVYAATAQGLKQYGQPVAAPGANLASLTHPSGNQLLILILTVSLAALILVGRTEWILHHSRPPQP